MSPSGRSQRAESTGWLVPRPVHQNSADPGKRGSVAQNAGPVNQNSANSGGSVAQNVGTVNQNGADSGRWLQEAKCRACQSNSPVSWKNLSLSWTRLGLSWTELGFSRKWLGFGLNSQGVRELSIKIAPLGVVAPRSKMVDLSIKIARIRAGWLRGATSDLSIKLGKC